MAAEERKEAIQRANSTSCPIVHAVDIIGETWRLNVLLALQDGELRFNELKRETEARSRTLSQTLETLLENDLVERRSEEADPIAVYYSLSEKAKALRPVFEDLETWADEWLDDPGDADPSEEL
ncbi:winged helix-turn-helix transcriptional regulator [Natronoarchaeum rubrum]|uniref:winged helix-turn-helix transcriptional regulator n=1 Tax=Natronoarchaeum rubrum TaxID=755311 RepID=UPI0021122A4C|nr:helix-turn-helix domain-containing protein [Natronoarchaeum rubrum]